MADTLKSEFNLDAIALISGDRGEFSLWLGDTLLAKKSYAGFPTVDDAIRAMRAALKPAD
ncbi:MAG: hypothetical protein P8R54_21775 [Myxococcota bacterium]|nr:hypothetical protein [Myxococcota bacterium]